LVLRFKNSLFLADDADTVDYLLLIIDYYEQYSGLRWLI